MSCRHELQVTSRRNWNRTVTNCLPTLSIGCALLGLAIMWSGLVIIGGIGLLFGLGLVWEITRPWNDDYYVRCWSCDLVDGPFPFRQQAITHAELIRRRQASGLL